MRLDLNKLDENTLLKDYDFCIVGSGPAGITLALELSKKGRSVALCEAGDIKLDARSQNIYKGSVVGDNYMPLDSTRLRYFGGSSMHWGGMCRTLPDEDFKPINGIPYSGWPIDKADLDVYFKQATKILELKSQPDDKVVDENIDLNNINFTYSPPVRFGNKYYTAIKKSSKIHLINNANLVDVMKEGDKIKSAVLLNYKKEKYSILARNYIFAMGGIENSRLMLWINEKSDKKVFDPALPLGKYWMEHLKINTGDALISSPDKFFGYIKSKFFSLGKFQKLKSGLSSCHIRLNKYEYSRTKTKQLINNLLCVAPNIGSYFKSLFGRNLICGSNVEAHCEQLPLKENRIRISNTDFDEFGIPRTILHWKKTENDFKSAIETTLAINKYFLKYDIGRLRVKPWIQNHNNIPLKEASGDHHHMGGTRMSDSPRYGVVDLNCKVFGLDNLFIAGSSVFPRSGSVNPTLTIVQLSLRLAKHLLS